MREGACRWPGCKRPGNCVTLADPRVGEPADLCEEHWSRWHETSTDEAARERLAQRLYRRRRA